MSGHWAFVAAAYGVAATIVIVMIVATFHHHRVLQRELARLEKRGAARRAGSSARPR